MRRSKLRTALGVVAGLAVVSLAISGCSSSGGSGAKNSTAPDSAGAGTTASSSAGTVPTKYTIGISNPTGSSQATTLAAQAVQAAGKQFGIKVIIADAQLNAQKQVSDINQFIAEKVNGIIVYPLSPDSLNVALAKAQSAGIKVLGWNAIIHQPAASAKIAPYDANLDNGESYSGAQALAKLVANQLSNKGSVLGLTIGAPVPGITFQVQQYKTYLSQAAPSIKWLESAPTTSSDVGGANQAAATALTKYHNGVDAVMAYDDTAGIGAFQAMKAAGISKPFVVSEGGESSGVTALKAGQLAAMVDEVPWRQGLIMATMMDKLLTGAQVPNWVASPTILYTKDNISQYVNWSDGVSKVASGAYSCSSGNSGGCPEELTS